MEIKNKIEQIEIKADSSFIRQISIQLKKSDIPLSYPIFFDSELEEISDLELKVLKGKRWKPFEDFIEREDKIELEYIASKKVKSIVLPPGGEYRISYKISCRELMYFSDLRLFTSNVIDTLRYSISMTDDFNLAHNTVYSDSLNYFSMDSTFANGQKRWNVELIPQVIEPDPLTFFGVYRNRRSPLMRLVVTPKSYENRARQYLNDWYLDKIKSKKGLSHEAVEKIDELTYGVYEKDRIVKILYDYVRHKFKYVAIEVGMGAFVPSSTNEVFEKKQGDCKDLSNFLVEALKYKGIDSYLALAATKSHITDCNFPSLSSANHIICIAEMKDGPLILDPTDPIHVKGTPVQSLQDRTVLIFNQKGGEWFTINRNPSKKNLIQYNVQLSYNSNSKALTGDFKVDYHGLSGNFIKRELWHRSSNEVRSDVLKFYENIFNNQSIKGFEIESKPTTITTKGDIRLDGKVFKDGSNSLLFMDFLPKLFETVDRENMLEGMLLENNFSKKVHVNITFDKPIMPFERIEYQINGEELSFELSIRHKSNESIQIEYDFNCEYERIEKNNIEEVNQILNAFKKLINDPIMLKQEV